LAESKALGFEERYSLAVCYQRLARYEEAACAFDSALEARPADIDSKVGLAQSLSDLPDPARAKAAWRSVVDAAPDREEGWYRLALVHYDGGELADAALAFEQCVTLQPGFLDAWLNLGTTYWSAGNVDRSVAAFKAALEIDPANLIARRGLAALSIDSGDAGSADIYRHGLAEDWEITYNLGVLCHRQGSLDKAAELYREVLNAHNDFAEAQLNLGNVLFALGEVEQGREYWQVALERRPDLAASFLSSIHS
jgi:tetratricopeptide (TPR) repeat protein